MLHHPWPINHLLVQYQAPTNANKRTTIKRLGSWTSSCNAAFIKDKEVEQSQPMAFVEVASATAV